jgi:uncharacterized protein YacL
VIRKIIQGFFTLLFTVLGFVLTYNILTSKEIVEIFNIDGKIQLVTVIMAGAVVAVIFGFLAYITLPFFIKKAMKFVNKMELELEKIPSNQIIIGSVGLIFGLVIAYLISSLYGYIKIGILSSGLSVITYIFFGYLGVSIATKRLVDITRLPEFFKRTGTGNSNVKGNSRKGKCVKPKILDTSVIIDGRIADICKTGFIEGPIIIPEFILEELRHIADSSDGLKRNRGRRGLDILKIVQQELEIEVQIVDTDFEDVNEVDIKLLKLALQIDGAVVTNDFNLNKVADLQGVQVLNINELANAVKPVVLPGEEMIATIVKEGKESNQGVAYLDDGTMIVVEGGKKYINNTKNVVVTSVLQTAAGRMIFAKPTL